MEQVGETGLGPLAQVAVTVQDVERATAFYRDVLKLPLLFEAPPGLAFFDGGQVRLMLSRAETPELEHASSVLYFRVEDIDGTYAAMKSRGVSFVDAPHRIADMGSYELWMVFFHDSEGNLLAAMEERAKA